jgi:hypothetical protein
MGASCCSGHAPETGDGQIVVPEKDITEKVESLRPDDEDMDLPRRRPTGLFTVELEFTADGVSQVFEYEVSSLGFEFEPSSMTVKCIVPEGPAEELGVKPGMVLTKISGLETATRSVAESLELLLRALADLPKPETHEEKLLRAESEHSVRSKIVRQPSERFAFQEQLYLTGPWSKWKTNFADGLLEPVPTKSNSIALLKLCVQLTSQSFTFQVITDTHAWNWHLYPRDAKPIKIGFISSHVSKEGLLKAGNKDAAIVGRGDKKLGHGVNFHVVEKPGTIVTVWIEVPAKQEASGTGLTLRTDTVEGARVWYTVEDTGLQCAAGDGINLSSYKKYLPADINLD